jgi:nitroimidazol reductase NimA-like FMN-containing flavoprotein (pyridoxamine 5'-phosphate oxidase superfamily)
MDTVATPGPLGTVPESGSDPEPALRERLAALFRNQQLAVLATQRNGQPYCTLVAFFATPDLGGLIFATARSTRKFENLTADPRASLLIDNRSNRAADFREAMAVTAVGRVEELTDDRKAGMLDFYLGKHPHLKEFVEAPTCALLLLEVELYITVERFQKVLQWQPRAHPGS